MQPPSPPSPPTETTTPHNTSLQGVAAESLGLHSDMEERKVVLRHFWNDRHASFLIRANRISPTNTSCAAIALHHGESSGEWFEDMDSDSLRNPTSILQWAWNTIRRFQASLNPKVDFSRKRHPADPSDAMSRRVPSTLPRSLSDPLHLKRKSSGSRGHLTGYLFQPLPPVKEMGFHPEECEMVALKSK